VYFNRQEAIGGLGRSPEETTLVQHQSATQAYPGAARPPIGALYRVCGPLLD
jgi:hypothetical protein